MTIKGKKIWSDWKGLNLFYYFKININLIFILYWSIVDLQCYVSFRCTASDSVIHIHISISGYFFRLDRFLVRYYALHLIQNKYDFCIHWLCYDDMKTNWGPRFIWKIYFSPSLEHWVDMIHFPTVLVSRGKVQSAKPKALLCTY